MRGFGNVVHTFVDIHDCKGTGIFAVTKSHEHGISATTIVVFGLNIVLCRVDKATSEGKFRCFVHTVDPQFVENVLAVSVHGEET